jgi:hypothetical protein
LDFTSQDPYCRAVSLKISRILHAGYIFECHDTKIAFDPIFENPFSGNCHAFPDVRFAIEEVKKLNFSAVFISHYHDDHCSFESLNLIDRQTPIFIYCAFKELSDLIFQLGFHDVRHLETNTSAQVGAIEVVPRLALDPEVDSVFHIKACGLNILNVVDAWIDPSTIEILQMTAQWDLVLWPFQALRELAVLAPRYASPGAAEIPGEWIEQLKMLNPRFVIPSSCQYKMENWSWYNHQLFPISYRQFQIEIESALPRSEIVRLNPGVSVILKHSPVGEPVLTPASRLGWIEPVGEQELDYHYQPGFCAPSTGEISKNFPALSEPEQDTALHFCKSGLIEKYRSLPAPLDEYFQKPRVWKLSLFDHRGLATHFSYRLLRGKIELLSQSEEQPTWSTEIPTYKLWAALTLGEALNSLYVRINDAKFTPEIEKEILGADILEDPLLRTLYNGIFGGYQIAQLKRIQSRAGRRP